jgi:hypothetical protein
MDTGGLQARDGCALGEAQMLAGFLEEERTSAEDALARARVHQERAN